MLEEGVLRAGLSVKHRHIWRLPLAVLHQSRERVERIGCGCYAGQGVGEDNAAGRAVRYQW